MNYMCYSLVTQNQVSQACLISTHGAPKYLQNSSLLQGAYLASARLCAGLPAEWERIGSN